MLVLKRITTKKLAIYITIIALAIGGTVFMLYQNRRSGSQTSLPIDNLVGGDMAAGSETMPEQASFDQAGAAEQSNQPLDASKIRNDGGADFSIFEEEKFKALEENIWSSQEGADLGKRNPFKPE